MGITAKSRSQLALTAETRLAPDEFLRLVAKATDVVQAGEPSPESAAAQVHVQQESGDTLSLSIMSIKRVFELCTFAAEAVELPDGRTRCRLGGLQTYRTTQPVVLGFIPRGPKTIAGYELYQRFLETVAELLQGEDPRAAIAITVPV